MMSVWTLEHGCLRRLSKGRKLRRSYTVVCEMGVAAHLQTTNNTVQLALNGTRAFAGCRLAICLGALNLSSVSAVESHPLCRGHGCSSADTGRTTHDARRTVPVRSSPSNDPNKHNFGVRCSSQCPSTTTTQCLPLLYTPMRRPSWCAIQRVCSMKPVPSWGKAASPYATAQSCSTTSIWATPPSL